MRALRKRGKALGVVAALAGLVVYAAVAFADTVTVNNEVNVDAATSTTVGQTGVATVDLNPTTGGGDANGCNAGDGGGQGVTVTVRSSNASVVALTGADGNGDVSVVFNNCDPQTIGWSALSQGTATLSITSASGGKAGSIFTTTDTHTINVGAGQTLVAPTVDGALSPSSPDGDNGWYKTVPTASWTLGGGAATSYGGHCAFPDSTTFRASALVDSTDTATGSVTCSATNAAGTGSKTLTYKLDATPPNVSVTGVSNGSTYTLGSVPAAGCSTSDDTSGVADAATLGSSGGPVGSVTVTCSGAKDNAGNTNSASVTYNVIYAWSGFFQPVDMGVLNKAKAGSAIPVKFRLGGDQGMNIFDLGGAGTLDDYPRSQVITCGTNPEVDGIEQTVNAGGSSLSYDALADQYVYVWKTDKNWAGTCRQLVVKLVDGTYHRAHFMLTK